MRKKCFKIGEWLPLPMIDDDMNIYYNEKKLQSQPFLK